MKKKKKTTLGSRRSKLSKGLGLMWREGTNKRLQNEKEERRESRERWKKFDSFRVIL